MTRRWQRELGAALSPLGLTHVQFVLLAVVWWAAGHDEQAPAQRELAALARTDPMMTSQVLRTLEAADERLFAALPERAPFERGLAAMEERT